jgi:hypothetical protein
MTVPRTYCIVETFGGPALKNSVAHGSWPEIMDHIPGTRVIQEKLRVINDAAHAEGKLQSIRDREKAVTAREDAVTAREDALNRIALQGALHKMDALRQRIDSNEADEARDPDDDELPLPPGSPMPDDGDLEAPTRAPEDQNAVEEDN